MAFTTYTASCSKTCCFTKLTASRWWRDTNSWYTWWNLLDISQRCISRACGHVITSHTIGCLLGTTSGLTGSLRTGINMDGTSLSWSTCIAWPVPRAAWEVHWAAVIIAPDLEEVGNVSWQNCAHWLLPCVWMGLANAKPSTNTTINCTYDCFHLIVFVGLIKRNTTQRYSF